MILESTMYTNSSEKESSMPSGCNMPPKSMTNIQDMLVSKWLNSLEVDNYYLIEFKAHTWYGTHSWYC